jgi:hypothetical protein
MLDNSDVLLIPKSLKNIYIPLLDFIIFDVVMSRGLLYNHLRLFCIRQGVTVLYQSSLL